MGLLTTDCTWISKAGNLSISNRNLNDHYVSVPVESCNKLRARTRVFASKKPAKKFRKKEASQKNVIAVPDNTRVSEDKSPSGDACVQDNSKMSNSIPSRISVLQACTVTSGLIASLGVTIRQLSHVASVEGWPIVDCSTETWPDFAESSEAANQQVLSSLEPLDYLVVASLSGFSEELLFRGAMLPLVGVNWKSALVVGIIFGVLHLGSGRKYSFAVWATFVGFAYGYATILSSSIIVPMASHAANNLVGGIIWRYTSKPSK